MLLLLGHPSGHLVHCLVWRSFTEMLLPVNPKSVKGWWKTCYFFLFYSDDWERRVCSIHGPSAKLQQRIVWTIVGSFGTTCTPLWGLYCTISEDIQGLVPSDIPPLNQPKDANVPKEVMKLVNFLKTQPQVIKEFKSVISRGLVCLKFRFTRTSVKNIKFSTPVSTQPSPLTT